MHEAVASILQYIQEYLEKPHPVFGDLPVCPYARNARLQGKILFHCRPFLLSDPLDESSFVWNEIIGFTKSSSHELVMFIHPEKDGISLGDLLAFNKKVANKVAPLGFMAFCGHPNHEFNIAGIYTRREPYPTFQIISATLVKRLSQDLVKTDYYNKWSDDNLDDVRFTRYDLQSAKNSK